MITKTKEADESSSTHQLADPDGGSQDYDPSPRDRRHGPNTQITSPWSRYGTSRDGDYGDGIHVRSELAVQVEHV